jgi:cell cycle sensor histidine kinase DivJ
MAVRWHLIWALAVGATAAAMAWAGLLEPGPALAALALIEGAALAGAVLSEAGVDPARLAAIFIWGAAGAVACLLTGGPAGPLAPWCLAPLAAAAAFGRPRLLAAGAATGVAAAAVAAMAAVLLPQPAPPPVASAWLSILALGVTTLGLAAGLVALQGKVRGEVARTRASEAGLRDLVDHQPQLLMAIDHAGLIVEAFGEAGPGLQVGDALGRRLGDLAAEDVRLGVEAALERAVVGGGADISFVPAHDPQGWVTLSLRRMADRRINATLRDSRVQRTREVDLEQARASAEQQNAGKSRFLANMSHELRTPLNAIMGFSDIMRQRLFGPISDRYAEYAELIHESGSHLLELINDVLDMSKIEAERFELAREDFDARDAITAVLRLMRGQADRAGIQLRGVLPAGALEADADRRAIKQIAMNLLSNALKFTPKGGSVTLTVQAVGPVLELVVTDTGVGISSADLARLGKPYEQAGDANQRQAGSGLGLSLVRAFAKLHGGDMTVESVLGEGTTVTVRMPVLLPLATPRGIDLSAEG